LITRCGRSRSNSSAIPARSAISSRDSLKARIGRQARQPRLLEGDIVVVVEIVNADDFVAAREQALADMHADKPGGAGEQDLHGRLL
jgi:hypothetical protein